MSKFFEIFKTEKPTAVWQGDALSYAFYGSSHAPCLGVRVCGLPAGIAADTQTVSSYLQNRKSGNRAGLTARAEDDLPEILSGIKNGLTTGEPVEAVFYNRDVRDEDYGFLSDASFIPRPSHADYPAFVKYGFGGAKDAVHKSSGRMTLPLVFLGALAKQALLSKGVRPCAFVSALGSVALSSYKDKDFDFENLSSENGFRVGDTNTEKALAFLFAVVEKGDSVGGTVDCVITGLPAGVGGALNGGLESKTAELLFGIPAVKAVEFGDGVCFSQGFGSEKNDALFYENGVVKTRTNHSGGLNGGMTNGMPLTLSVTFRPTPTIARPQDSVDLVKKENATISVFGRHDACVAVRGAVAVESAAALAVLDALCAEDFFARSNESENARDLSSLRKEIDVVDDELSRLLLKRRKIVKKIGKIKKEKNLPLLDKERENDVLRRVSDGRSDGETAYLSAVYESVFSASLAAEEAEKKE